MFDLSLFSCPHEDPTTYRWGVSGDIARREVAGRSWQVFVWHGVVLSEDAVMGGTRYQPYWPSGGPPPFFEARARYDHAAFLADPEPLRAAMKAWLDEEQWRRVVSEITFLLDRAREEGGWRIHMHIDATPEHIARVHQALQRLKQGHKLHRNDYEGYTDFWWSEADAAFRQYSWGNNPYSGETREMNVVLSASEMHLLLLQAEALVAKLL